MKPFFAGAMFLLAANPLPADEPHDRIDPARKGRLATLLAAVRDYRSEHDGTGPAKLAALYYEGYVRKLSAFVQPGSGTLIPARADIDAKGDYTFAPVKAAPDLVVREKRPRVEPKKVLAAFADGTLRLV